MTFWKWSKTAATNATADSTINWAEGQPPSSVNNSARAMMAAASKYRDDICGALVTSGTSTAYTVSSNQIFDTLAHLDGAMIAFTPHATNGQTVTLSVDGLGAKPLRPAPSVELQSNTLIQGTPYVATYNNTDAVWYLQGMGGNAYGIPLGAGMDYWGATAPSSAFAFPAGQAVSRTGVYAPLFSLLGTTYGVGDGTTTFNLPDKTERVSVMKATAATRLTATYFGGDSTALGAVGGLESATISTAQMPAHDHGGATGSGGVVAASVSGGTYGGLTSGLVASGSGSYVAYAGGSVALPIVVTGGAHTHTVASQGSGDGHKNVQPTIVCNYIIRVI